MKKKQETPEEITYDQYTQAIRTIAFWSDNKAINKMHESEINELNIKLDKAWKTKRGYISLNNKNNE